MYFDALIRDLKRSLSIFDDCINEETLEMIEKNKQNLVFNRYLLGSDLDFGLVESFASRCYHAKLFMETMQTTLSEVEK